MLNDVIAYGPVLMVIAVLWASYTVCEAIGAASNKRHEDHNEMISELSEMRQLLVDIEVCTSGMARVVDPPPTVDEMIAQFERDDP